MHRPTRPGRFSAVAFQAQAQFTGSDSGWGALAVSLRAAFQGGSVGLGSWGAPQGKIPFGSLLSLPCCGAWAAQWPCCGVAARTSPSPGQRSVPAGPLASSSSPSRRGSAVCAPRSEQTTNPRHVFSVSLFPCLRRWHVLGPCGAPALSVCCKHSALGHRQGWQRQFAWTPPKYLGPAAKRVSPPCFPEGSLGAAVGLEESTGELCGLLAVCLEIVRDFSVLGALTCAGQQFANLRCPPGIIGSHGLLLW